MPQPSPRQLQDPARAQARLPDARARASAARWFAQPQALALMGAEQRALIPSLTGVFGQAGLYLRPAAGAPPELSGNMLLSVLRLHGSGPLLEGDLRCEADRLPIADDSLSLVYALHAFDTCSDPRALCAEIARVLAPEGVLVVIGLNPFSPWALRWAGRGPRVRAPGPLRGQLGAHGLQVFRRSGLGPVWAMSRQEPAAEADGIDWLAPVRAGYALIARKRRSGITPLPLAKPRATLGFKPFPTAGCVRSGDGVPARRAGAQRRACA